MSKASPTTPNGLPTPRLQFRWEKVGPHNWHAHYELVLAVGQYDIRNPNACKAPGEHVVKMGGGTKVESTSGPVFPDGTVNTPFRDGAHMRWDAEQLRIEHVYAIYGEHVTELRAEWKKWDARKEVA